jgi:polar amino acid transport system permease protein
MGFVSPGLILHYVLSRAFCTGALMTLLISVVALALGMVVGLAVALAQKLPGLRLAAIFYLWLFRGTPVMFQLIFVFSVLPAFGLVLSGFTCAVLALGLNEGAYMAEIMRSGLEAVGRGPVLAARALGMRENQVLRHVVLPQALRIVVPPIGNQFIGMLKLSALVSVIAVPELLLIAERTASATFRYLEALAAAGIYYLGLTTLFMLVQAVIEWRLGRRRRPSGGRRAAWPALTQLLLRATADAGRTR